MAHRGAVGDVILTGQHFAPPSDLAHYTLRICTIFPAQGRMKATHDYVAKNANELTFTEVSHHPPLTQQHSNRGCPPP